MTALEYYQGYYKRMYARALANPDRLLGMSPTTLTPDYYWSCQPAPVQVLRTTPDYFERITLGEKLAAEGYTIDRACMVDQAMLPADVFHIRENNFFTWVPAANQPNIPTMPYDDVPGFPPYDREHPPAYSIHVPFDAADYAHGPVKPSSVELSPPQKPQIGEEFTTSKGVIFLPGPGLNQNLIADTQTIEQDGKVYLAHVDNSKRLPIYFTVV